MKTSQLRNLERKYTQNIKRESCFACGKHEFITELHHIVPLKEVIKKKSHDADLIECENEVVWLCPNCHTYLHKMHKIDFDFDAFERYMKKRGDIEIYKNLEKIIDLNFDINQKMENM